MCLDIDLDSALRRIKSGLPCVSRPITSHENDVMPIETKNQRLTDSAKLHNMINNALSKVLSTTVQV